MAELTQLGSLDSEKWLDIPGFTDFRPVLLVTKCHAVDSSQISHLCRLFFCQYSLSRHLRFMTTGGSEQRPIEKLKPVRSLKAPVSSLRNNQAHAEPGADPRGATGAIAPSITYGSIFIHRNFLQLVKQYSRYKPIPSSIVLSQQQFCEVYIISLTEVNPQCNLNAKYYWNRPPKLTGWIRPCAKLRYSFTKACINAFVLTSVTREYHPKVLERLHLLQCIFAHVQNTLLWTSWETQYLNFLVLIFVPVWSHAAENRPNACWRPCWEDPHMQYQFVRKKQMIHPAVPSSDTLVDNWLSNWYRPGISKNFGRGPHTVSYSKTIGGPDILRNVIFSGRVPFYQTNRFFVNISFLHYWQNGLRPGEMASQVRFGPRTVV